MRLIRNFLTPIEQLKDATRTIASGEFGHQVDIQSGDEFEGLGQAFNEMNRKLKENQELLMRSTKLAGIGQMAAGIVHEIKQPLSAIDGYIQLSLVDEPPGDKRQNLEIIQTSVQRLNNILQRFSSFSHMSDGQLGGVNLPDLVDQVYELLAHQLERKKVECIIESQPSIPPIIGDTDGLQQVFSNLMINAMHAMEDKQDGQRNLRIRISVSQDRVMVEIQDNGCGIPPDIQKKIFDPFFTTKGSDKGTGLGMAIVESIIHKHDATITLKSEQGHGTTFFLSFPAFQKKERE
jgi:two-component system sensor histidine kinase AtoS